MKRALFFFAFLLLSFFGIGQVNLNLGLLAYYPFSGNANDASGNGNNGTVLNGASLTTDRFGNPNSAYYFDGIDDYISVPNSANLNPPNGLSIALYFNPSRNGTQNLIGKIAYTGGVATQFQVAMDYAAHPGVLFGVNPISNGCIGVPVNSAYVSTVNPIAINQWYCVVATFDNGVQKIYLNGVLIQTANTGFTTLNQCSNATIQIAKWWSGDPLQYQGKIDDIRIYDRALNQDEVDALCLQPTTIINDYTPILALNPCDNKITVENASAFNIGDTVLMIQMKGVVIDSTNTSNFGTITDYKNAGNYEFNYVKSKTGNIIELKNKLSRHYDIPDGRVQLIHVPYYQNATVTSTLSCLPWDGSKGGVLVLNAADSVTLTANIDVSGNGFRGGNDPYSNPASFYCYENQFYYPANPDLASEKGEGIAIISTAKSFGKGALANGGGGGNSHNSGGGGGGNVSPGGLGGYQYEGSPCDGTVPFDNRGLGGKNLVYSNGANKIFMGGGGGAGQSNDVQAFQAKGGNGGGIIIIMASKLKSNGFKIISNGNAGVPCGNTGQGCLEGMGGGGAAGAVLMGINTYLDNGFIDAKGGAGADMTAAGFLKVGPGGGGGGGFIWYQTPSNPANVFINNTGGLNGVCTAYANFAYGATPGTAGATLTGLQISKDTILFKPNIDSVRVRDSATGCTDFNFQGLAYTNTNPISTWQWYFGDGGTANIQNTSHTYSSAGTYAVKLVVVDINGCKDSITVNVATFNQPNFDFNYQVSPCNILTVQLTGIGANTQNPYWNFGDNTTATGNVNQTHIYAGQGIYTVQYSVTSGACTDTISKTINLTIIPEDIITTVDTTICPGATKQLFTKPALSFCWTPATYLDNPASPNPITSTPQNITYYFTAQATGSNLINNGDFTGGNSGFTSQYVYANPNTTEGQYFVGTNPQAWNVAMSNCPDHTSGTGNMMTVNGSPVADVGVWQQLVAVTPNTNYAFSTWIQALWPPNPAQLQFSINGKTLGNLITASLPVCTWTQFYTTWNSGNNVNATISIVNKNTQVQGNDFALDDISFAPVYLKRDSVRIAVDTPSVRANADTSFCQGYQWQLNATGATSYSWSPPTGLSNPNISDPVASPNVPTQYSVTGVNANGCIAKDTVNITVYPKPAINTSADTAVCKNSAAQLFASGGSSYSWSPAATLSNPNIANPVATPAAYTVYYVTVTGANSCSNIDSVSVDIRPDPNFTVGSPNTVCDKNSVQLVAGGGDVYSWQPAATLNNPNIPNPTASPQSTTNYTVLITDTVCNNSTTLSTIITVLPLPAVAAQKSNDIDCTSDFSQLNASGANNYSWTPAASLSNPNIANPVATPTVQTQYVVKGRGANGCVNYDTVTVNITVLNKGGYLMPSAFTPNNDGANDCYGIRYWGIINELDFAIYDRWGEKIFHTTNPGDCWNGMYKGALQKSGVYVYLIKAKTSCGDVFKKGTFVLIR